MVFSLKKNYFDNQNKIKTAQRWAWLTVPVKYRFGQKLNEVEIGNHIMKDYRNILKKLKKENYENNNPKCKTLF